MLKAVVVFQAVVEEELSALLTLFPPRSGAAPGWFTTELGYQAVGVI